MDPRTKRIKRSWVKIRNRNEAIDLEVGCLAGLFVLQELLFREWRYRDLAKLAGVAEPTAAAPKLVPVELPAVRGSQRIKQQLRAGWSGSFGSFRPRGVW